MLRVTGNCPDWKLFVSEIVRIGNYQNRKSFRITKTSHPSRIYQVSHNLWQFPGNWLQIAKYGRYSNFEAIFEMPCLFT